MTLERIRRPSSTTAAAVSSHELSIPRTSMGLSLLSATRKSREALEVGCSSDTDLGNDSRHELVGCNVKRGIEYRYTLGNDARVSDVRHFDRSSLLDGDVRAVRNRKIERGQRSRYIERNVVLPRQHGDCIGSDFIRHVAIRCDAVGADDHGIDQPLTHESAGHVVGDNADINVVFPEFPRCQSRALKERPRLVGEDLEPLASFNGCANYS